MNNNTLSNNNNNLNKDISIAYLGPRFLPQIQIKILTGIKKIAQTHNISIYHFAGPFPYDTKEMISQTAFLYTLLSIKKIQGITGWSSQLCNDDGFFFDIEGFLEKDIKRINKYVNTIERESDKLLELINQILDLFKIEEGKFEIR